MACRVLIFILTAALSFGRTSAEMKFVVVNGGSTLLSVKWLPHGTQDDSEGSHMGSVNPSGREEFGVGSEGHAFRIDNGKQRSKAFVYSGGTWNAVGARLDADGVPVLDVMGPKELRAMVVRLHKSCIGEDYRQCAPAKARFLNLGLSFPAKLVHDISEAFSPFSNPPTAIGDNLRQQGERHDGTPPPDEFVVMSALPYPLELQWVSLIEEPASGLEVSMAESQVILTIPAAELGAVASVRVSGVAGQMFFVAGATEVASPKSLTFLYPGELAAAAVTEGASGVLDVEVLSEDDLKVYLSSVAMQCGALAPRERKTSKDVRGTSAFKDCLVGRVFLPSSKILVPPGTAWDWFKLLWTSLEHWRLCIYQEPSVPVANFSLDVGVGDSARTVLVDILRKEPLVIVVNNLASLEECKALAELAGDDLGMAHVSGGGTSRIRRTLSKNLYPDLGALENSLTQMANRFFEVARQATGFELQLEGQEPVNWLYYKPGYEYRPHCDGACGAKTVARRGRVASSLLYCAVAEEGGGTVFPPDGLKLQPKVGNMLLFTYNPDPHRLTEHSACPVLKGEKMTATQWYREGVTLENNWEGKRTEEL